METRFLPAPVVAGPAQVPLTPADDPAFRQAWEGVLATKQQAEAEPSATRAGHQLRQAYATGMSQLVTDSSPTHLEIHVERDGIYDLVVLRCRQTGVVLTVWIHLLHAAARARVDHLACPGLAAAYAPRGEESDTNASVASCNPPHA
jgi:hypothetical protein